MNYMYKINITILVFFLWYIVFPGKIFAGTFRLVSIGNMKTYAANYGHWWYTSPQPVITGSAMANAAVTVDVDSSVSTVNANANGDWSFTPTTLNTGDHAIKLSSGGSTISFTLTIGEAPGNISAPAESTTPVAGNSTPLLLVTTLGAGIIFMGLRLKMIAMA